jgi:diketogulonate reductase-like aldo/keto reductase
MANSTKPVPAFLYGTAWKEDETRRLVRLALEAGFRGIDTANQRKHYHEAAVGQGIADAVAAGVVTRDALFIQTKFTHRAGQDQRLPYDPKAPIATQVRQSCQSSLEHLAAQSLDSYVLHGPSVREGLAPEDLEAWRAMEELHGEGLVHRLGVSNVTRDQLALLCDQAKVRPTFVQNRCYARTGWDRATRALCAERGVVYQGFSLLTANQRELEGKPFRAIVARTKLTAAQAVFAFARRVGMLPLTGTTDAAHMREDLAVAPAAITDADVKTIESLSG